MSGPPGLARPAEEFRLRKRRSMDRHVVILRLETAFVCGCFAERESSGRLAAERGRPPAGRVDRLRKEQGPGRPESRRSQACVHPL